MDKLVTAETFITFSPFRLIRCLCSVDKEAPENIPAMKYFLKTRFARFFWEQFPENRLHLQ
jgi:hypothetical protein